MKHILILLTLFSCSSYTKEPKWTLGKYKVVMDTSCNVEIEVSGSSNKISNLFGNNSVCSIAKIPGTNIPNAFVVGGGYILIIEQKINLKNSCRRASRAIFLPNKGQAQISSKEVKSGNCDGRIESNSAMYMVSSFLDKSSQ